MITFKQKGDFINTDNFFKRMITSHNILILEKYARRGVEALSSATPVDSGETANSWNFEIKQNSRGASITWTNSNIVDGIPVAILIQYGHATRNGGYVQGRDYINPAMQHIFDNIAKELWGEVTNR
jgi:hypothetical protein